ncbi:hypothetical protein MPTK2_8g02850 [Marchantia polymorpha subsp. ruderalis]
MADVFQDDESLCESIQVAEPLPGKELEQIMTRLEGIENPDHISTVAVEQLVSLLAGRVCIDGTEDNFLGAHLFTKFCPVWEAYLVKNPKIRARVDPFYVISRQPFPANFSEAVARYTGGARFTFTKLPSRIGNFENTWAFPNRDHGLHFLGHMSTACPNARFITINSSVQVVIY